MYFVFSNLVPYAPMPNFHESHHSIALFLSMKALFLLDNVVLSVTSEFADPSEEALTGLATATGTKWLISKNKRSHI